MTLCDCVLVGRVCSEGCAVGKLTCDAADLRQVHHDLGEALGLVWVLALRQVLAHVPVALVQLLHLLYVGQASDVCEGTHTRNHTLNKVSIYLSHTQSHT